MGVSEPPTDVTTVGILGYGEVGRAFAAHFAALGYDVVVTNRSPDDLRADVGHSSVTVADSPRALARQSELIIAAVWPETAVTVAEEAADGLSASAAYVDVNSIAPATVTAVSEAVAGTGAAFVNVSLMDSVRRFGTDVRMALAGPAHQEISELFEASDLRVQDLGPDPVRPAVLKLSRSTVTKGMLAVFAEALLPALEYDLTEEVLESVDESFERQTVGEFARFFLADTTDHAARRTGELEEVLSMMAYVDVDAPIATQAHRLHQTVDAEGIRADDYQAVLRALRPFYRRDATSQD